MNKTEITQVMGHEILDSRGNPTLEVIITLADGSVGRGMAPSGASTGKYEAHELRDKDPKRYHGKGVLTASNYVNTELSLLLLGEDTKNLCHIDRLLIKADKTPNKSRLGANTTLAISIASAKAASASLGIPLYEYLGGASGNTLPVPMMNILNGGAHASNNIDIQEFMIMPVGAPNFREGLRYCTEVYHTLASLLKEKNLSTAIGDEGGFAPTLSKDTEALDLIITAIQKTGLQPKKDICLALDCASSEWKSSVPGKYLLPKSKKTYDTSALIDFYTLICDQYPIVSLEDPLGEEDWDGWQELTSLMGNRVQLVGDDLFVTNEERLKKGISFQCGNSILIKPNQIGTLTESMDTIKLAKKSGYTTIASHRSGETEDTSIADLAVGLNTGQIKTGAPARGERVAKYNRLLRIESSLGESGHYPGENCLPKFSGR